MANCALFDMPERLERIEPASEARDEPGSRNFGGGAKSSAVKVPDLRSKWGLGMTAKSSYELARGVCGRTAGLNGLGAPSGLSGRMPFCLSRYVMGGAKSAASKTMEFSVSFPGVGSEERADGGGRGFLGAGAGRRPLIDDMLRGG